MSKAQIYGTMETKQVLITDKQVEINYYQKGQGDTALVFLHGWCNDGMYWQNQLDFFSKTYNVIALDLPGFGKSKAEHANWTIDEYADDVSAFIDSLKLKNVVIIGHSMSAEIMLQVALANNPSIIGIVGVDKFKSIDVALTPEQTKQIADFFPMLENDFVNSASLYAEMMLFHPATPQTVKDRVKTGFAKSDPLIGYRTFLNQTEYSYADAQRLEQLNYRLYLINSDASPTNQTGLENHCKNGFHLETVSAAGHYPMLEKPEEFNLLLAKVLAEMN